MKYIKVTVSLICFAIIFASCNKTSNQGKMIPNNAGFIVDINAKSLSSKLSWDEIKQTSWYKKCYSDSSIPAWVKTMMDDPSKDGIDTKSDLIFFIIKRNENYQLIFEGSLKDASAFTGFNKNFDSSSQVSKDGNLNILKLKDKAVAGWNDDKFVYVFNAPDKNSFKVLADSAQKTTPLPSVDNLVNVCKNIFSLPEDSSLYKNEKFAKLVEEDGDMHFWINSNELYKGSTQLGALAMLKIDKFLEGNISTGTINFENGRITTTHKTYAGKELSEIFKKYSGGDLNTQMIDYLPSSPAAVLAMHLPPQELIDIVKLTGLDGFINMFLAQKGLSMDDIVKATNGDLVFSLNDFSLKTDSSNSVKHDAIFLFAASVADKDAFNKIINTAKTLGNGMPMKTSPNYKMNDKYFVLSNSTDAVNNFLSGNKSSHSFLDKIKDHSVGGFIDLQTILKSFKSLSKDSIHKTLYDMNVKMWDNIFYSGGDYKDGASVSNAEINLMDKNTNSLKQLNNFVDAVSQEAMTERKQNAKMKKDSLILTPPIIVSDDTAVTKKILNKTKAKNSK